MTLSDATTPGQTWYGSSGNEGVFRITQNSSLTIKLYIVISRTLVSGSYHTAEIQSVYSATLADWSVFYFW